tara:strand:- start:9934 stop:10596 length:663 start_codon:yes stop_codon:yes gene_type:complete
MVEPLLHFDWKVNKEKLKQAFTTFRTSLSPDDYIAPDRLISIPINRVPTHNDCHGYYKYDDGEDITFYYVDNTGVRIRTVFKSAEGSLVSPDFHNVWFEKHRGKPAVEYIMFEMDSLAKKLSIEKYIVRCLILKPNNFLTWHKDGELVKASVNFHIGESRDPVTFWPNLKYEYNTALLNNQHFHKVDSVSSERVTLKLISLSSSYEDIYKRIKDNDCKIY